MKNNVTAMARVHVTVEVETGSWGNDCKLDQVNKQARESAMGEVRAMLQRYNRAGLRLVDAKVAGIVLVEEQR